MKNHEQLICILQKYGNITSSEKIEIEKYFIPRLLTKKEILVDKCSTCNKIFFVNSGYIRAYYLNENGKEITRMIAWKNRFLTNIGSFKGFFENNEYIECVKQSEILYITRSDFENMMQTSSNLKYIYANILEEYNALYVRRFESLNVYNLDKKMKYLKSEFPNLVKELNDNLLASFIGISRIHYVNNKHLLF